jgi:hypothetical protein
LGWGANQQIVAHRKGPEEVLHRRGLNDVPYQAPELVERYWPASNDESNAFIDVAIAKTNVIRQLRGTGVTSN